MSELWLPVVGYEGLYEISNLGRVRSMPRTVPCAAGKKFRVSPGKILKQANTKPYLMVPLSANGVHAQKLVHRLVLEAFAGPCPNGFQACHFNGNAIDNRIGNLRWDSPTRNHADNKRNGVTPIGESHHAAKLSVLAVRKAREMHAAGATITAISRHFGVSRASASKAIHRNTWGHVA